MPKIVSRTARREEICAAAMRILAREGPSALTLRSLAAELGGSITLVTYFFDDKADLFEAIVDDMLQDYSEDSYGPSDDAFDDLRRLVEWFVPGTPEEDEREAGRIALITLRSQSSSVDHFFVAMERRFRELFGHALSRVVPEPEVEQLVDFLRAALNGLVLSLTEHPDIWNLERRDAYVKTLLSVVREHELEASRPSS